MAARIENESDVCSFGVRGIVFLYGARPADLIKTLKNNRIEYFRTVQKMYTPRKSPYLGPLRAFGGPRQRSGSRCWAAGGAVVNMAAMHIIFFLLLFLLILLGPSLWVRRVMRRYLEPADRYGGTGAQFARHLLDQLDLQAIAVEETAQGDHYDPADKVVRLSPQHYTGKSLAAVTVAAHEVGHALQDAQGFAPLKMRTRMVQWGRHAEKLGAGLLMAAPLIAVATRAPGVSLLLFAGGLMSLGSTTLIHLVTLPTEFDASFRRAMPLLEAGEYLHEPDYPHARRLLRAAALTYVSASLMSLLNIARWWAILRR